MITTKDKQKIFIEYTCGLCGYNWISRIKKPKQCPKCKRYDYNLLPKSKDMIRDIKEIEK